MANITVDIKKKSIDIGSNLVAIGKGGMNPGVYDPQEIKADVFDMDNMVDGVDKHYLTTEQIEEFEAKQDALTAGDNIDITNNVISATDTTYTAGDGISIDENNVISNTRVSAEWGNIEGNIEDQEDLQEALEGKQDVLTAGANVQIENNVISATDTTYTAGQGISIDANNVISNTQTSAEWGNIQGDIEDQSDLQSALADKQDVISDLSEIRSNATAGKDASDTVATYGDIVTHDADEFATADSVGEGVLTIQKNSTTVDTFSANATENKTINITVPTQASDIGALPDTTKYAANLDLSINSSTYVVTAQLKDQDGNNIGNQRTIDLPLESVVVSGSYDSATKEVVLTLEGGSTIRFSVADLVSGLQTEITSTNKLDADLVDDSTSTNKFVTAADLTKLSNTSGVNTGDQSASDFDIKDLADTTGLRNTWSGKQGKLTAGDNINISDITEVNRDTRGPAPVGYHIPTRSEWNNLYTALVTTLGAPNNATSMVTYLKMPIINHRDYRTAGNNASSEGKYWSATVSNYANEAYILYFFSSGIFASYSTYRANGCSIRCFKDTPVVPNNSWTVLLDGSNIANGAGVFHDEVNGLISISGDGINWITIQDKNLGATTVYNDGDTFSQANVGNKYQWGNNYGFAYDVNPTTNNTQVDAGNYGPGNYYSSNVFIITNKDWSSVNNNNLWGGVSGGTWNTEYHIISATDTTYEAGDNISITGNEISATDMKADVQTFTSKYQMIQWDTAKKGDIAKVQNTETNTIVFNGSTTVLNGVEGGLKNFVVYGYSGNVSPLPDGYVQYDKVSGNATISTGLSGDLATYTIAGDQGPFKLRQDGVLVFNAVPCKNTSNVVGFYDLVSNGFFTPSATLTAGDEITGPTPEVPRPIMTNNGILKYNKQTSEWYTEGDVETIKISYLG